jgi:hypothetical protein
MSITLFGSCRLNKIKNHNNLNNLINYTHSTKEVIQYINFLKGELKIPQPYNNICFRTGIIEDKFIEFDDTYKNIFLDTKFFIIEISSNKKYIHNNFYLHHLSVDSRFEFFNLLNKTPKDILDNYIIEKQNDEEIENDILEIQRMLYPKKIIIVSHYNSKKNNEYLNARNNLINLLDKICNKYNIEFINPTNVLSQFSQDEIMTQDLGHYTELGKNEFAKYIDNYIKQWE